MIIYYIFLPVTYFAGFLKILHIYWIHLDRHARPNTCKPSSGRPKGFGKFGLYRFSKLLLLVLRVFSLSSHFFLLKKRCFMCCTCLYCLYSFWFGYYQFMYNYSILLFFWEDMGSDCVSSWSLPDFDVLFYWCTSPLCWLSVHSM